MRGKGRGNEESRRGRGGAMTEFSVVRLLQAQPREGERARRGGGGGREAGGGHC